MERGFNDDELADIMSEIESLEQEFSEEIDAAEHIEEPTSGNEEVDVAQSNEESVAHQDSSEEETVQAEAESDALEMQEVLDELSDLPEDNVVQVNSKKEIADRDVHHSSHGAQTSMSFSVSGEMTIALNFNVGDEIVQISVNEHEGLFIEMGNGAQFCLPLHKNNHLKKAS